MNFVSHFFIFLSIYNDNRTLIHLNKNIYILDKDIYINLLKSKSLFIRYVNQIYFTISRRKTFDLATKVVDWLTRAHLSTYILFVYRDCDCDNAYILFGGQRIFAKRKAIVEFQKHQIKTQNLTNNQNTKIYIQKQTQVSFSYAPCHGFGRKHTNRRWENIRSRSSYSMR